MIDSSASAAADLLLKEAWLLDRKNWSDWLGLYAVDARYWAPAWLNEYDYISDPETQVSLIYHTDRDQLQERISRIQSRKSITALPLPRTVHIVSNILIVGSDAEGIEVTASFVVHVFDPRTAREHSHFGHYEYRLKPAAGELIIAAKKIILANDRVPTIIDFYTL